MSLVPETFAPPSVSRFDWWGALGRVLSSIEAVREGRAMYILLAAFSGSGLALACAQRSLARGDTVWTVVQGAAALFIAFYGSNAAGLIMMDRAMGRSVREVPDAIEDALLLGHRVLLVLLVMGLAGGALGLLMWGLYALCALPTLGPWLYVLVAPVTVLVVGAVLMMGAAVVAPLTGPIVWSGAGTLQSVRELLSLIRGRLLQAGVLVAGLGVATALVGAASSVVVLLGGRAMALASVLFLGVDVQPEVLMAGLLGYGLHNINAAGIPAQALPYISSATVGGGVVFAIALVLPTLVYLRGVCEVYLALRAAERLALDVPTA